jgi:hypothetical protein
MGFQTNAQQTQSNNDAWRAQGFLNLYLPSKDGGKRRKLGAIPLKKAKPSEGQLIDWLKEDPSRVKAILAKLEIEFQSSEPSDRAAFDLG